MVPASWWFQAAGHCIANGCFAIPDSWSNTMYVEKLAAF
jgi:hypothetical protein